MLKVPINLVIEINNRKYTSNDGNIHFNANCKLYGDANIIIYHAKSLLGGGKVILKKILLLAFC